MEFFSEKGQKIILLNLQHFGQEFGQSNQFW